MVTLPLTDHRPWGWFGAWALVGAAFAVSLVGILTVGIFVLPFAIIGTVLLTRSPSRLRGLPGVIAGLGLPLLYVAYLNRGGPGEVCSAIPGGESCTQALDPWPWLAAGLLLITAGVVVYLVRSRRSA